MEQPDRGVELNLLPFRNRRVDKPPPLHRSFAWHIAVASSGGHPSTRFADHRPNPAVFVDAILHGLDKSEPHVSYAAAFGFLVPYLLRLVTLPTTPPKSPTPRTK